MRRFLPVWVLCAVLAPRHPWVLPLPAAAECAWLAVLDRRRAVERFWRHVAWIAPLAIAVAAAFSRGGQLDLVRAGAGLAFAMAVESIAVHAAWRGRIPLPTSALRTRIFDAARSAGVRLQQAYYGSGETEAWGGRIAAGPSSAALAIVRMKQSYVLLNAMATVLPGLFLGSAIGLWGALPALGVSWAALWWIDRAASEAAKSPIEEPLPPEEPRRAFSPEFRQELQFRNTWIWVAALIAPPAVGAAAGQWTAGLVAAIAASHWTAKLLGRLDNRALSRRVAAALGCAPEEIAGLGPAPGHLLYDGFYEWDLGCVRFDRGCLEYRGEAARFSIPAAEIATVRLVEGPPKWHATPVTSVEWTGGSFLLYWAGSAARARERHAALAASLCAGGECEAVPPDFSGISGASPLAAVRPGTMLRSQAFVALYSTSAAALLDFPGGAYIPLAAAAGLAWQYLPVHWRGRCSPT